MSESPVNHRAQQVLKILVERYIQDGCPIGSKTIAEEYSVGLSPASVRNILADLESAGYLTSPHVSAGRIPTPLGYRLFVNSLLSVSPFEKTVNQDLHQHLNTDLTLTHLLQSASSLLTDLTQLTGIVAMPRRNKIVLRQVEFLRLSAQRILVILVLKNREVQNRIIDAPQEYSQNQLQQLSNFINQHYVGKDLLTIRHELAAAINDDQNSMTQLLVTAMEVVNKALLSTNEQAKDYVVTGQNNLLNRSYDSDLDRVKSLFEAINQKQDILKLLDQALEAEGIQIFIGKESGHEALTDCSIVTTSYAVDSQLMGSLAVIGPTRMPYEKVISAVDVTAKLLSAALNQE